MIVVRACDCREFENYIVTDFEGNEIIEKERLSAAIEIARAIDGVIFTFPGGAMVVDW